MTWLKLDDGFPRHRKVRRLSHVAFRLHVSALCWCAEQLTDGVILTGELDDVSDLAARELAKAVPDLVERGLWESRPDGWVIHDYLTYNPSREKVLAERERTAARQQAFRDKRRNGVSNGVTNGVTNASVTGAPARPGPTPRGSGSGRAGDSRSETRANRPVDNSRSPLLSVVRDRCSNPHHVQPLRPDGTCLGCEADRKAASA